MRNVINSTVKRAGIVLGMGLLLTGLSWVVVNFNLKLVTVSDVAAYVSPNVASYFETCHGSSFNTSAPDITVRDRGFPIAYTHQEVVPICGQDRQTVDQTFTETDTNWLMVALNTGLWAGLAFKYLPNQAQKETEVEQ
jgi:hypothetical protein